jgi:hypothetical protein
MKIRLAITLTIGRDQPAPEEERTVDLVGTHHDVIPEASYDIGFHPGEDHHR